MTGDERRSLGIQVDVGRLRDVGPGSLGVRFAFGVVISVAAALVGLRFGHAAGGLFLAFPAILPASLTMISESGGDHQAQVDAIGAVAGALGMAVFAAVAIALLPRAPLAMTLAAAAASWLAAAAAIYFVAARLLAASGRATTAPDRSESLRRHQQG